jgi:hypothetical protein
MDYATMCAAKVVLSMRESVKGFTVTMKCKIAGSL